jgi:prefoldin alpha subunit
MDKAIQRKYLQAQILGQQLEGMVQEKNMLSERMSEVMMTMDALKKMDTMKKGNEMWSTLGSGVFVSADIKDKDTVLVSVGAGIVVRATANDTLKMIETRFNELNSVDKQLGEEMNKYAEQINKIEIELQAMAEKEQEKQEKK